MPRHTRKNDPLTSYLAAASTSEEHLTRIEKFVYAIFQVGNLDLTDEELVRIIESNGYPASPQGARTARANLTRRGLLEQVGEAKTRFGRKCRVWAIAK